jgi:hypothetical protein
MADTKITGLLSPQVTTNPATDVLPIVNIADTLMASSGSTRKITVNQLLGSGGTATLASATITGNLTLSAGTVNGVGYLNASRVLTAGSALVFDGTNLGIGGTGQLRFATSGGAIGDNSIGTENSFSMMLRCGRGSTSNIELASDKLVFSTNSSERYRIASDGVATWSNVGGVAGTAMTLNATGLGVGTSPAVNLDIASASTTQFRIQRSGQADVRVISDTGVGIVGTYSNHTLRIRTNGTDAIICDTAQNVGVGVTPSAWRSGARAIQSGANGYAAFWEQASGYVNLSFGVYEGSANVFNYKTTGDAPTTYKQGAGTHAWYNAPSGFAGNAITFTQAMTLDASGRLLVGQTSTGLLNINGIDIEGGDSNGGSYIIINHKLATAAGQQYAFFAYNGVKTGDITQSGTTGVLYNTVSDYRLKESVKPISGGLARVNALKPSIYKWKSDGSAGEGFLAHELAEVVPLAVTGEKDAVNEDGSMKTQGVDLSKVVPILVSAIQELTARVQTLEAR